MATVTFEAEMEIEEDAVEEPGTFENWEQALQDRLGHTGVAVNLVIDIKH